MWTADASWSCLKNSCGDGFVKTVDKITVFAYSVLKVSIRKGFERKEYFSTEASERNCHRLRAVFAKGKGSAFVSRSGESDEMSDYGQGNVRIVSGSV